MHPFDERRFGICLAPVVVVRHNGKDYGMPSNQEIYAEFWKHLNKSPFVMAGLPRQSDAHSEPMTALFDEEYPNTLFFYASAGNRLLRGLVSTGPDATLQYASKGHDFFACLAGKLSVVDDPSLIDRFWSPMVDAWFEGGKQDPDLRMLRFDMEHVEMWEADLSIKGKLKLMTGRTIDKEDFGRKHMEATV